MTYLANSLQVLENLTVTRQKGPATAYQWTHTLVMPGNRGTNQTYVYLINCSSVHSLLSSLSPTPNQDQKQLSQVHCAPIFVLNDL